MTFPLSCIRWVKRQQVKLVRYILLRLNRHAAQIDNYSQLNNTDCILSNFTTKRLANVDYAGYIWALFAASRDGAPADRSVAAVL
jgi:hypothetical protein